MYNRLPNELITRIYEYDNTYKDYYRKTVMPQLIRFSFTSAQIVGLMLANEVTDRYFKRCIKYIVRSSRKADLKSLCKFMNVRLPKHITKKRMTLLLYIKMFDVVTIDFFTDVY